MSWLIDTFFPTIAFKAKSYEGLKEKRWSLEEETERLKKELNNVNRLNTSLQEALTTDIDYVTYVKTTKRDEKIIVKYNVIDRRYKKVEKINIYAWLLDDYKVNHFDTKLEALFSSDETTIIIGDLIGKTRNKGIGQALMELLFEIAKENEITKIIGELGSADLSDHKERLVHFYEKMGFTVNINPDGKNGKILKVLN